MPRMHSTPAAIGHRPFGATGLQVSELGLGCASYWGMARFPERDAIALVQAALDLGITVFDTGASYSGGNAEPRLGRALRGHDVDRLLVSSKAGTELDRRGRLHKDFSPPSIRASVERSLRRLQLPVLPLLYLHGCPPRQWNDDLRRCLDDLKQAGLIRWAGLNSFDPAALDAAVEEPMFDAVMLDYNVLRPQRAASIGRLADAGKAVVAGTSLARAGFALHPLRIRRTTDIWYWMRALATSRADLLAAQRLRFLNRVEGWSAAQLALRHVLDHPRLSCAMFGTTRLAHLQQNVAVSGRSMPADVAGRISAAQRRMAS